MDEPKFTYLFGAGASAQTLPVVKMLPKRISEIANFIDGYFEFDEQQTIDVLGKDLLRKTLKESLVEGLRNLQKIVSKHSTIDTYARKLYLNFESNEICNLNLFLAIYFSVEQHVSGIDPRYETFLISILKETPLIVSNHIKFLSWNYDAQMEGAYAKISGRSLTESHRLFNGDSNDYSEISQGTFSSTKLNGHCFIERKSTLEIYPLWQTGKERTTELDHALKFAYLYKDQHMRSAIDQRVNINFAWNATRGDRIKNIVQNHAHTEILTVIGYSFPFFNRHIDRQIIRGMKDLKKIYIQDTRAENIVSRFLSILPDSKERKVDIIPVNDVSEFFLPPEL